jgi:type IV pilus assembly protein PilM
VSDSVWKKELSFKRKPKPQGEEPAPVPAADEPQAAAPSVWKKEISFKRKPKGEKAEKPPAEEAPKQSIWKKDISLARKSPQEKEIERLAAEAAQAVAADAPAFSTAPPTELAEAVVAAMPAAEPEPEPEPAVVVPEPEPVPEPVAVAPEPEWAAPVPEPEPWLAEPELPPAPEAPTIVEVHPPVPAAELPPLEVPVEPKVPFWKKDVSLSRKPKAAKQPKPKREKKEKPAGGAPFWKKELSLGRKRAAVDPEAYELPKAKSAPFWKRELAFSAPKLRAPALGKKAGGGSRKAQRLVGLKIGASQIAAARVSNNGVAELQQLARDPLAPDVVVAGEVRDPEALAAALKLFFARHKLPKKGVRLGIASNRIGVRIIDIVGVDAEKQLANAVQFRAQEALPIPLDEAVLDYRVLDESVDEEGQSVKRVLLVVAYRELVDRYVNACRTAGIALAGIDLEAFALLRSLGAPADRGGSALVAIAIGHERSTFAVSDGRICEFTRVVEWGGSALNVALARAFDSTPSEVEALKQSMSLDGTWAPDGLAPAHVAMALDAVRRQVQSFARELVSSLQFYQNQPGSLGIGEIVITGGTAQLPGLADELHRLIGVPVRVGNPLARLKVAKRVTGTDKVGSLAVAIGLGIED